MPPHAVLDNATKCGHKGNANASFKPRAHVEGPGFFRQSARAFAYPALCYEHSAAAIAPGLRIIA